MTYRLDTANDTDHYENSKLIFDNATVMKPLVDECLKRCENVDCNYGSFDVASIINKNGTETGSITLEITPTDHRTQVISSISKTTLAYSLIVFVYLFFGLNVYEHLIKRLCLKSYFDHLKRKKKTKRNQANLKLIILSLITMLIGLSIGYLCEWRLFNFGKENKVVVLKRESAEEMNASVSICFDLPTVLTDTNHTYTADEWFQMTLNEINNRTWTVKRFKMESSMRNEVGAVPIRHDEKVIDVFYRKFRKCFRLYYESRQLFPHIYLQRKSHIYFNTGNFSHFYVESDDKYPQLESPEFKKSSLFTLRINKLKRKSCRKYTTESDGCTYKDDCIQTCVLAKYRARSEIPVFVNLKETDFASAANFRFVNDKRTFEEHLKECKSKFPAIECDSANITGRPKYLVKDKHSITINLTPNLIVHKELEDEDKLVVFNRILGVLVILTGFSVREFVSELISLYLVSYPAIGSFRLTRRIGTLIVSLLFAIHFVFLYRHIINHELLEISYKAFLKEISLPKLRFCFESDIDLTMNNYTKNDLDRETLSSDNFFIGMNYLDADFNYKFTALDDSDTGPFKKQIFYLDNLKCFSILYTENTPVARANILLIDQLVTVFVQLEKVKNKRFLVYLNVENTIDLEWSTFLYNFTFYNLYFSTKEFVYSDDYYYLKNIKTSFIQLFDLYGKENTQRNYFKYLLDSYNREQYATTTILPLLVNESLPIKNDQFNAYIHFRSIDGNKNDWDFTDNKKIYRFSYDLYKESPEKRDESVLNKSIVALRPNLSCLKNQTKNKYNIIELFLHLFIVTTFWLKVDVIGLPEYLKRGYPVMKFFLTLLLYIILSVIIFLFELSFKFFGFFK